MAGRHKVFLGMAAGGRQDLPHAAGGPSRAACRPRCRHRPTGDARREETTALAEGLDEVPRRHVRYRGVDVEEMDVPAILKRRPELCLIDELAHTNAPGMEHRKRYEDVADVLDAGPRRLLDGQHPAPGSLNDQVADLTGVRVRETVPDEGERR